jgi:hypothetical protein
VRPHAPTDRTEQSRFSSIKRDSSACSPPAAAVGRHQPQVAALHRSSPPAAALRRPPLATGLRPPPHPACRNHPQIAALRRSPLVTSTTVLGLSSPPHADVPITGGSPSTTSFAARPVPPIAAKPLCRPHMLWTGSGLEVSFRFNHFLVVLSCPRMLWIDSKGELQIQ